MNRNHYFTKPFGLTHREVNRKVAFHEAGHAAAIYLGNKQKGLPPIFFRIVLKPVSSDFQMSEFSMNNNTQYLANIDGGRLINKLPDSIDEVTKDFSSLQKLAYLSAFEADMINILVGPLAEAKYVAIRDGELITPRLVDLNALHNYGGTSDLDTVRKYLECFPDDKLLREQKITELFLEAFNFINERLNWAAITALADYIVSDDQSIVEFDEVIDILEAAYHEPVSWFNANFLPSLVPTQQLQ
jgi:hypothetical protein